MSDFFEILSNAVGPAVAAPRRPVQELKRFETDGGPSMTFVGYEASEIVDLLAAYREHLSLIMATAKEHADHMDAVHYRPDSSDV